MQWKATKVPSLKAEVNGLQRPVAHQQNGWRNDQWCVMLKSLELNDQLLWTMTKLVMIKFPLCPLPWSQRGISLSQTLQES
jgi:hypothetical protein